MENFTIAKLGNEKVVNYTNKKNGRPDSFNKIGFQCNEKPEVWFDFTYRGSCPLVVGNKYEFEVTPREYNGKTYFDAKLPKKAQGGDTTAIETKLLYVSRNVDAGLATGQMLLSEVRTLIKRLENKGVLDSIEDGERTIAPKYPESKGQPNFGEETNEEPPLEAYEQEA